MLYALLSTLAIRRRQLVSQRTCGCAILWITTGRSMTTTRTACTGVHTFEATHSGICQPLSRSALQELRLFLAFHPRILWNAGVPSVAANVSTANLPRDVTAASQLSLVEWLARRSLAFAEAGLLANSVALVVHHSTCVWLCVKTASVHNELQGVARRVADPKSCYRPVCHSWRATCCACYGDVLDFL